MKTYENYPIWMVIISNFLTLSIYGLGIAIILKAGLVAVSIFIAYIIMMEFRLVKFHCIDCFYYGKTCGFGKGRISSLFFKKGDVTKFCKTEMTWKEMIPDLLVPLIPLVVGIYYLVSEFNIYLLINVILLVFLSTVCNGFVRGKMTCVFCKQKELGCPADKLFSKNKKY